MVNKENQSVVENTDNQEFYNMTNILSGNKIEGKEFYYECDSCAVKFDWHPHTVMRALIHFNKKGHKDGRLSVRDLGKDEE